MARKAEWRRKGIGGEDDFYLSRFRLYYTVRVRRQRERDSPCTKHRHLMQQSSDKGALLFHIACFLNQSPNESLSPTNMITHKETILTAPKLIVNPIRGPPHSSTHLRSWILMSLSFVSNFLYDLLSTLYRGCSSPTSVFPQTGTPVILSKESPTSLAMLNFRVRVLCRLKYICNKKRVPLRDHWATPHSKLTAETNMHNQSPAGTAHTSPFTSVMSAFC